MPRAHILAADNHSIVIFTITIKCIINTKSLVLNFIFIYLLESEGPLLFPQYFVTPNLSTRIKSASRAHVIVVDNHSAVGFRFDIPL